MTAQYHYGECPVCEFSVVVERIPPKLASACALCAEDNGRDVFMVFRVATDDDKAEGYDARAGKALGAPQ